MSDSPPDMKYWIFTAYRPLWIILNLALITVTLVDFFNSNYHTISIDLPNIKAQTAKVVKNDAAGQKLATDFGFKARSTHGLDFCTWASSDAIKVNLKAPFDKLDCTEKYAISLKDFQAYDLHTYADAANTTVWHIYAYGARGEDGELFTDGATMKEPTEGLDDYLKNNGIYTGPDECATKKLKNFRDWILALFIVVIFYFVAHIAHWVGSYYSAEQSMMTILDRVVLVLSTIVYILAIVVFAVQERNELFTKCAWLSTWFQTEYVTLYGSNVTYVVCGSIGLFFCLVHVIAIKNNIKSPYTYANLVVGDQLFGA